MFLLRLNEFINSTGISFTQFEKSVNASRGSISGAIKHKRNIGSNVIEKILQKYPDLDSDWLLRGEGKMHSFTVDQLNEPQSEYHTLNDGIKKNQQIPLYNLGPTTGLVEFFQHINEKRPLDFLSIPNLPKCDGAVIVTSDSMYPLIKSGDIIIYKQIHNINDGIFWGEIYLVSIQMDDEEYIAVKYIQKSELGDDHVKLASHNDHHQPMDVLKSNIRALAMIKASVRINSMK